MVMTPLYPLASTPWDVDTFRHPPQEYRGAPFWSWNTTLQEAVVRQHIAQFAEMGMGGFHIHVRTGLTTPYLGKTFMQMVRVSINEATRLGLRAWLYDEDRWPSGFAGGLVTRDPHMRAKHLLFTTTPYGGITTAPETISNAKANRTENGILLARYLVHLDDAGYLHGYHRLANDATQSADTGGRIWYAYLETAMPSPWWNDQTYVDTLDPDAIARFIAITHDAYAATVGEAFGTVIPAIFTDEPQFTHKVAFQRATDTNDVFIPWTTTFVDSYHIAYGADVLDTLPEIFWELSVGATSVHRYRYHDHVCERFTTAFADQLGHWCSTHNLRLTGHMMEEPTLTSQTSALGEAMRAYRSFHVPGMDLLMDKTEYTTAKQVQSAAHQYGREGVLSELYGVTNWDFPFAGHKAQGDWQAALGVTVRVPHLAWMAMGGEAKRDYPASIFTQSPWWREYPRIEDHFARLNLALTRGERQVRVGVLHPIESFWLCFGPINQTSYERDDREHAFADLTAWLLFGLIDFDFIAESLLPALCPIVRDGHLVVGHATYDVVIVPGMRTIRSTTLDRLEAFQAQGGHLLFLGEIPSLVDAQPSDRAQQLALHSHTLPFARSMLLDALETQRDIALNQHDGRPAETVVYQFRRDGPDGYLFLCHTDRQQRLPQTTIRLRGHWQVLQLDTLTGEQQKRSAIVRQGWTEIDWDAEAMESLLLRVTPGEPVSSSPSETTWRPVDTVDDPVPFTASEPNVLLLDRAEWRINGGDWQREEEILRIDNRIRQHLGLPQRGEAFAQPWSSVPSDQVLAQVELRIILHTVVQVHAPRLVLEEAHAMTISLHDRVVSQEPTGWFVDPALTTLSLPDLDPGKHILHLSIPFRQHTQLEWLYLLGQFGVTLAGRHALITPIPSTLAWGDWTTQGLPFYGGNVTYHTHVLTPAGVIALHTPHVQAPIVRVQFDGVEHGAIFVPPFTHTLGPVNDGWHTLDLTAYGHRFNTFGAVHNADPQWQWWGPDAWRTTGDAWTDGYRLRPMGILSAPLILLGHHTEESCE